jgi:hypothetical protein
MVEHPFTPSLKKQRKDPTRMNKEEDGEEHREDQPYSTLSLAEKRISKFNRRD